MKRDPHQYLHQDQGERLDDLQLPRANGEASYIIQNPNGFCSGTDAVMLADFTKTRKDSVLLDIGTGCGIIPILLALKGRVSRADAIEIQPHLADMARRSVCLNEMENSVNIMQADLREYDGKGRYTHVTCNPPYKEVGGGLLNPHDSKVIARHEVTATLRDCLLCARRALSHNGKLTMIHKTERLVEIVTLMRELGLEPKRMAFVHPRIDAAPVMVMVEGAKGGRPKLFMENPIYLNN